jgi:DNA modification methylase
MDLRNGDCLEVMKDISNNSIDLLFCDLPYGQTSCKWDCLIDLDLFWKQINRICKDDCPMFFTCSTKFGVSLINSNPKNFRYDLVWVKSAPCGFLNAKKMPMKKHEMVYVFYKKIPKVYTDNIAEHHTHKFIKETENKRKGKDGVDNKGMIKNRSEKETVSKYDPPLPNSVIKTDHKGEVWSEIKSLYGDLSRPTYKGQEGSTYEPPLPISLLEVKSERGKHATQKPVDLIKWCLKYYSKEGDTVLDPTCGSASTGVACKEMNRKFIGIEMDEKIFKVAVERVNV